MAETSHQPALASQRVDEGRKTFIIELRENHRGRFIRLVEIVGDKRDTILIPLECLNRVMDALDQVAQGGGGT